MMTIDKKNVSIIYFDIIKVVKKFDLTGSNKVLVMQYGLCSRGKTNTLVYWSRDVLNQE